MKRLWIVLLLLTGLSACSTKMSYYFLDWAIEWELAEYVDFNSQQSQAFEAILEPFLAWHRHQELPRYSQQLRQLRQELAEETLTPERWGEHVAQARDHWYRLFEHVFDDALPLFTSLSDSQVAQILEQLEEDEQELVEERQDKEPAELLEESDERLEELFSDWVGRLSETQKEWIHAYNRHRQSTWPLWIA